MNSGRLYYYVIMFIFAQTLSHTNRSIFSLRFLFLFLSPCWSLFDKMKCTLGSHIVTITFLGLLWPEAFSKEVGNIYSPQTIYRKRGPVSTMNSSSGGVVSVVKDIWTRIGLMNVPTTTTTGTSDELGAPHVIKGIWNTISHYMGRHDLDSFERLEDIGMELLSGFAEREKETISFYLYNMKSKGIEPDPIKYGSLDQLRKSPFVVGKPVKFLIHGFKMNRFSQFNRLLTKAYLKQGSEVNVFNVDWRRLAGEYDTYSIIRHEHVYLNSAFNTRVVGDRLGEFIIFLKRNGFIESYDQVHLIGFSLGAHVAGYTGRYVLKTEKTPLGRITGLDPAGPSFTWRNRLDKSDANFVDVIHTSQGGSGIIESIGHVDFFPNGGEEQPRCNWDGIQDYFLRNCSHQWAFYLYLETIKGKRFWGCPCKTWEDYKLGQCSCTSDTPGAALIGEYCNSTSRGDKFLKLNLSFPLKSNE